MSLTTAKYHDTADADYSVKPFVHPNHTATAEELIRRLGALNPDAEEMALTLRVIVRKGVARKWKWNVEDETCPSRTI